MMILTFFFSVISIIVLLRVLGEPLLHCSGKPGQGLLIFLLLISLVANAGIVMHDTLSDCFLFGEGQSDVSPDGRYNAAATSYGPLFGPLGPCDIFFTIESTSRRVQDLKAVRIDIGEGYCPESGGYLAAMRLRGLPPIVHWSADSREVEFRIPEAGSRNPGVRLRMADVASIRGRKPDIARDLVQAYGGILVIGIGSLLLFWGTALIRYCVNRPGKGALICLLLISLVANVVFSDCLVASEGQSGVSPDGLYDATVMSYRPLWSSQPPRSIFFAVRSTAANGREVKAVRIDIGEGFYPDRHLPFRLRDLPQIVHWSADSREVEFRIPEEDSRIPGVQLVMTVKDAEATAEGDGTKQE